MSASFPAIHKNKEALVYKKGASRKKRALTGREMADQQAAAAIRQQHANAAEARRQQIHDKLLQKEVVIGTTAAKETQETNYGTGYSQIEDFFPEGEGQGMSLDDFDEDFDLVTTSTRKRTQPTYMEENQVGMDPFPPDSPSGFTGSINQPLVLNSSDSDASADAEETDSDQLDDGLPSVVSLRPPSIDSAGKARWPGTPQSDTSFDCGTHRTRA